MVFATCLPENRDEIAIASPALVLIDIHGEPIVIGGSGRRTLLSSFLRCGVSGTGNLMPADFPIDEHGRIVEACYGSDAGDRIPLQRVELFLARGLMARTDAAAA